MNAKISRICFFEAGRACLMLGVLFLLACVATSPDAPGEKAAALSIPSDSENVVVEPGDLVGVLVTASLSGGQVFFSNDTEVIDDPDVQKVEWFYNAAEFGPEEVVAGKGAVIPGLDQAVIGMRVEEKQTVMIPSDKAFGPAKTELIKSFPCRKTIPRTFKWTTQKFTSRFKSFPSAGREVFLGPYVKTRVAEVGDDIVRMENLAKDGKEFKDGFGMTRVSVDGENIHLVLTPKIGAEFEVQGQKGKIIGEDGDTFQVDFNSPLAGKDIVVDVNILSVAPRESFQNITLPLWEEYDAALAEAADAQKPVVLVLYRDGCSWCEKLLGETLEDLRVKNMNDDFIWVKINSGRETQFMKKFAQKGSPMIVYLRSDGTVVNKSEGFQDGRTFSLNLKRFKAAI